jgi:hypothetical protein
MRRIRMPTATLGAGGPVVSADVIVGSKWGYRYTGGWRLDAPQQEVKEHSLAMFTDPARAEPASDQ